MRWRFNRFNRRTSDAYEVVVKVGDTYTKTLRAESFDDAAQRVTRQLGCSIRCVTSVRRVA